MLEETVFLHQNAKYIILILVLILAGCAGKERYQVDLIMNSVAVIQQAVPPYIVAEGSITNLSHRESSSTSHSKNLEIYDVTVFFNILKEDSTVNKGNWIRVGPGDSRLDGKQMAPFEIVVDFHTDPPPSSFDYEYWSTYRHKEVTEVHDDDDYWDDPEYRERWEGHTSHKQYGHYPRGDE